MEEVKNCWEYMRCGYEPDGRNDYRPQVCPAPVMVEFDGVNRGKNGGRFCWCIAGTYCRGRRQGGHDEKFFTRCLQCAFFQEVQGQEGRRFILSKIELGNPER